MNGNKDAQGHNADSDCTGRPFIGWNAVTAASIMTMEQ
jgi:hypothetical protein